MSTVFKLIKKLRFLRLFSYFHYSINTKLKQNQTTNNQKRLIFTFTKLALMQQLSSFSAASTTLFISSKKYFLRFNYLKKTLSDKMTRKLHIEYDIHGYMYLYLFRFLFSAFLASVALIKSPFGSSWILEKGKQSECHLQKRLYQKAYR